MIVKNQSNFSHEEINELIKFVISNFKTLIKDDIEIHIRQYNGRGHIGIAFPGFYPDFMNSISKKDVAQKHLITDIESTTKQFAIVYVTKTPTRYKCGRNPDKTWQELLIVTLVHELRHLWHDRKRMGFDEEEDCRQWERKALKKFKRNNAL